MILFEWIIAKKIWYLILIVYKFTLLTSLIVINENLFEFYDSLGPNE